MLKSESSGIRIVGVCLLVANNMRRWKVAPLRRTEIEEGASDEGLAAVTGDEVIAFGEADFTMLRQRSIYRVSCHMKDFAIVLNDV